MAAATFERLLELETTEDIQGAGGWDYLVEIVEDHGLGVNTNTGGHGSRTLVDFKNDIIAALVNRLNASRPNSPDDSYHDVAQLTAQFEHHQVHSDSDSDSDESKADSQAEQREREQEELAGHDPNGWYDDGFDGRAHGGHVSDGEEDWYY